MFDEFLLESSDKMGVRALLETCSNNDFITRRNRLFSKLVEKRSNGNYHNDLAFESVVNLVRSVATSQTDLVVESVAESIFSELEVPDNIMEASEDELKLKAVVSKELNGIPTTVVDGGGVSAIEATLSKHDVLAQFPSLDRVVSTKIDDYRLVISFADGKIGFMLSELIDGNTETYASFDPNSTKNTAFANRLLGLISNDATIKKILEKMDEV